MKSGTAMVWAAARFYAPLIVLFALLLLVTRPAGAGVGLVAGLALLSAFGAYALVLGSEAARRAAPSWAMRVVLSAGLFIAVLGATAPRMVFARELVEAGLLLATGGGGALFIVVLFGRAPTMRDHSP